MLSLQKRAVERVYSPERLSKENYFNDLEDSEEPIDMIGKGSDYYRKQHDLQEAMFDKLPFLFMDIFKKINYPYFMFQNS